MKSCQKNLNLPITDEKYYKKRRLIFKSILTAPGLTSFSYLHADEFKNNNKNSNSTSIIEHKKSRYVITPLTKYNDVTTYNNYYEFGTGKSDPSKFAPKFLKTDPWSIEIEGLVSKAKRFMKWIRKEPNQKIYCFQ